MPLYEYQCDACGHRFERIQKFSDPPESACPECRGSVRKLLSPPAIQFKGSGWYITDYARKGADGGGSTSAETKGDTAKTDKTDKKDKSDSGTSGGSTSKSETKSGGSESSKGSSS